MATVHARSKHATDLMHRLWDNVRSCWVKSGGKSIWEQRSTPAGIRERLIKEGRDPSTLTVERVHVEVK